MRAPCAILISCSSGKPSPPAVRSRRAAASTSPSVARSTSACTSTYTSWHTAQPGFGAPVGKVVKTRVARRAMLTMRSRSQCCASMCSACTTTRPDTTALVVAIAGMMFPAICLVSKRVFSGMWYTCARRLAAAVTKPSTSSSSLSKAMGASDCTARAASAWRLSRNRAAVSATESCCWSRSVWVAEPPCALRASASVRGAGRDARCRHMSSMLSRRRMSTS